MRHDLELVAVQCGTNNIFDKGESPVTCIAKYDKMVKELRELCGEATLVLSGVPPVRDNIAPNHAINTLNGFITRNFKMFILLKLRF
jgi:hypothetical protein